MNRRHFLMGTASGVAAFTGLVSGQAPAGGQAPAAGRQGGRGGGRGNPIPPEKLARISMMTLNHNAMMRTPWATGTPTPNQTMSVLDLPQYYVDTFGVRNVEFQHGHLAQDTTNPDPAFLREMKAKLDAAGSKAQQVNAEIGTMSTNVEGKSVALTGDVRATWLATGKKWVDAAGMLGMPRVMLNQGPLTKDSAAGVTALWKDLQDYARPKGIKISNETRGGGQLAGDGKPPNQAPGGGNRGGGAAAKGAPGKAAAPSPTLNLTGFQQGAILTECAEAAGAYTNLDFGGNTRFLNQKELNDAIKMMLKSNSGSMHIKSCENWDIGLAVKYAESQGYKGLYTIEVNPNSAITVVIASIVSML